MDQQTLTPPRLLAQMASIEHELVGAVAAAVEHPLVIGGLRCASHYGDGYLSGTAVVLLLLTTDLAVAVLFVAATVLGLGLQRRLKERCRRCRPCHRQDGPPQRITIPDAGSFPSGHTLHAVLAALVVSWFVPAASGLFVGLAVVVAASRVVLGVHYPSDVLAGASLGAVLGLVVLLLA